MTTSPSPVYLEEEKKDMFVRKRASLSLHVRLYVLMGRPHESECVCASAPALLFHTTRQILNFISSGILMSCLLTFNQLMDAKSARPRA